MEGVGWARDRGCGRGQGWSVWDGPGIEGVGGDRDGGYIFSSNTISFIMCACCLPDYAAAAVTRINHIANYNWNRSS